jgi:hypothetical protein
MVRHGRFEKMVFKGSWTLEKTVNVLHQTTDLRHHIIMYTLCSVVSAGGIGTDLSLILRKTQTRSRTQPLCWVSSQSLFCSIFHPCFAKKLPALPSNTMTSPFWNP